MFNISFIKDLNQLIGPNVRKYLILSLIIGLLLFGLETLSIIVLQGFLVALGIMNTSQALIPSWYSTEIYSASFSLIMLGLLRAVIVYYRSISKVVSGNVFLQEQRSRLFHYGMHFAHVESTQSLVSHFSETIHKTSGFISILSSCLVSSIAAFLLFFTCFKIAPFESLLGVIAIGALLLPLTFLTRNVSDLGKKSSKEIQQVSTTLISSFKNYFFLRLSNMINSAQVQMDTHLKEYADLNNKYASLSALKSSLPGFIGTVVVAGITLISHKYFKTDTAVLLTFFFLFTRAGNNFSEINSSIVTLKFHRSYVVKSIDLMKKIDAYDAEVRKDVNPIVQTNGYIFESLALKDVFFSYTKDEHVFNNLNFEFNRGDILLIKGESGVGKSTLVSLILGVNKPSGGVITLNGKEDKSFLNKISSVVGYVGPEPYLITGTVRENLIYGLRKDSNSRPSDDEIWNALEMAQIKSLILTFENKLDEVLNEHVQISTGQKQRLSIARAFLKKPQILVFDEATANLDKVTEEKIIEQIIKMSKEGKSIVLISHKESFDKIADKKIIMEKGIQPVFEDGVKKHNIQVH